MNFITEHEQKVLASAIRHVGYFFILVLVMVSLWKVARICGATAFEENGLIENMQCLILGATALLFALEAVFMKPYRVLLVGFSSLCLFGLCREQDAFFDAHVPFISWKFAFLFPFGVALYFLCHLKTLKSKVIHFCESPSFCLMMAAMMIIIPIAECIGHKPLITSVLGTDIVSKPIQRLVEESGELCGYILIFLAGIEFIFNMKDRIRS